jgi:arginyl-tRNA synthetase
VYYVQYAHARIASINRVAAERGVARLPLASADVALLEHPRELDVLRSLFELPDVMVAALDERAPHKVTTWVRELADRFHGFYHDCYVMGEGVSAELTQGGCGSSRPCASGSPSVSTCSASTPPT